MYSQCREKREGRLSNVWNTPAEISGACFCNLVELFLEASGGFFAHPWTANVSLSFPGARLQLLFWLSEFQFAGNLMGKSVLSCAADKP